MAYPAGYIYKRNVTYRITEVFINGTLQYQMGQANKIICIRCLEPHFRLSGIHCPWETLAIWNIWGAYLNWIYLFPGILYYYYIFLEKKNHIYFLYLFLDQSQGDIYQLQSSKNNSSYDYYKKYDLYDI